MAVYGEMIGFFPELFQTFNYFYMTPLTVAGFSERENEQTIRAVFQYVKKGSLKEEGYTLSDVDVPSIWTKSKLVNGWFIEDKDKNIYRIVNSSQWEQTGGFYLYSLETYTGNTDKQTEFIDVDIGIGDYD